MLVSEEQELQLGIQSAPSLKWEFGGPYRDASLEPYLDSIVRQLWRNSERANLPVQFYIQNTSVPNAFALPGYVAITRGLLCDMENEAQFAAVIGHEIGHVMARHTAQRISRIQLQQLGLAIGAAALDGTSGGDALLTIGAVGSSLLLLKYDRSQEIQADRLGVKYMAQLGYDPNEAVTAHKVLEKSVDRYVERLGETRREDSIISDLMSTHPRTEVRLTEIQDMINALPSYSLKNDGKFSRRFQEETRNIRNMNTIYFKYDKAEKLYGEKKYSDAETLLLQAIAQSDRQAPFHNLMGFIKLQGKNYAEADKFFENALSIEPHYQPSIYGKGLVHYYSGEYSKAVLNFRKSLDEFPGHALTHFGLGRSYFQLKQYAEAAPYLRNFAGASPKNPDVHGLLGICYDNMGEIKPAVVEYEAQVRIAPDTDLGQYAQKRLAVLQPALK